MCSDCETLGRFQLGELKKDCSECCTADGKKLDESTKYPKAILEVCGWRLGAYPQVQAFIKSDRPARYPGLTIKYVRGADPIIKLLDEDESVAETLAVDKWNTDSVEEFLSIYLEPATASTPAEENAQEAKDEL